MKENEMVFGIRAVIEAIQADKETCLVNCLKF